MSSSADQRPKAAPVGMEVTDDAFLGGRVQLWQPANGFRAGLDSVVLAAAVPARARESVCDLGAGVGTASLCLASRVGGLHITALEIERDLADLATANAARNGQSSYTVIVADVLKRPRSVARQGFHHVMTNPPFHDIARGTRAPGAGKARSTSAHVQDLIAWLRFARALAKPQGWVTAIVPPEQLATAVLALSPQGLGVEIIPLWPKLGTPAKRLIIRTRMNSKAGLQLLPGTALHDADGTVSPAANSILRQGEPLIR